MFALEDTMGRSFCVSMIGDSFLLRQRAVLHEAEQIAERLLFYKDCADFLIGGDGDFDHIAVSSVFYACARHSDARGRLMLFLPEGGGSIYERADLRGFLPALCTFSRQRVTALPRIFAPWSTVPISASFV